VRELGETLVRSLGLAHTLKIDLTKLEESETFRPFSRVFGLEVSHGANDWNGAVCVVIAGASGFYFSAPCEGYP
jgi:hypothetical protein